MKMPFTREQFFDSLGRYNDAVGPAPLGLVALSLFAVALVVTGRGRSRAIPVIVAALWTWMAVAYHFAIFTLINPAAWAFGVAFLGAAALFLARALRGGMVFEVPRGAARFVSAGLLLYAWIGYPLVGWLAGHVYPKTPTFGLPCPTTIFTLGLLLLVRRPAPLAVFVVPLVWSGIGSVAAFRFGVVEDYGLSIAGVVTGAMLVFRAPRWAART